MGDQDLAGCAVGRPLAGMCHYGDDRWGQIRRGLDDTIRLEPTKSL